ncbi:hypothetical protein V1277_004700 [Bradyrhizobium sp. AZCC 1588]
MSVDEIDRSLLEFPKNCSHTKRNCERKRVRRIGAYDPIESAAEPLLQSTRHILETRQRPLIQTHSLLLEAYRRATTQMRSKADQQVGSASQALRQQPGDAFSVESLTEALQLWSSLWSLCYWRTRMRVSAIRKRTSPPIASLTCSAISAANGIMIRRSRFWITHSSPSGQFRMRLHASFRRGAGARTPLVYRRRRPNEPESFGLIISVISP